MTRPALLFADEPTGNLDYTTGDGDPRRALAACVERRQTIVLVTHDSKAAAYADRVASSATARSSRRSSSAGATPRRDAAHRAARPARPVGGRDGGAHGGLNRGLTGLAWRSLLARRAAH